jgi:hypothetical protein
MQKQLNIFKHRGNPIVFFANWDNICLFW